MNESIIYLLPQVFSKEVIRERAEAEAGEFKETAVKLIKLGVRRKGEG